MYVPLVVQRGMPVQRWRWGMATAIVAVLGVGLVLFLGNDSAPSSTNTTVEGSTTTAAVRPNTTTPSTTAPVTSTTTAEQRQAEVEALLQELWFGWFDAIYRKDPDALWEVVATTRRYDAGLAAMESMTFEGAPSPESISISRLMILLDRPDCLVVDHDVDVTAFRGEGAVGQSVSVLWSDQERGWRFATSWASPDDLWEQDCDLEREVTP
ncbi:MAG TPA: hypothetical protein VJR05_04680 [Acidimicrobiia bacterium]|nr:hypothetical protein [Acidimicrobiia bacterium]